MRFLCRQNWKTFKYLTHLTIIFDAEDVLIVPRHWFHAVVFSGTQFWDVQCSWAVIFTLSHEPCRCCRFNATRTGQYLSRFQFLWITFHQNFCCKFRPDVYIKHGFKVLQSPCLVCSFPPALSAWVKSGASSEVIIAESVAGCPWRHRAKGASGAFGFCVSLELAPEPISINFAFGTGSGSCYALHCFAISWRKACIGSVFKKLGIFGCCLRQAWALVAKSGRGLHCTFPDCWIGNLRNRQMRSF